MSSRASRDELSDHNARVRRLARAYAPKYRPVVLILGYAESLNGDADLHLLPGWSIWGIETIVAGTARYTANGKPLSRRRVLELMADLADEKANALIVKERFSGETGRQRSSYRKLNHYVAVNRYGWGNPHDWDAPLEAESDELDTSLPHPSSHPWSHPWSHPSSHPVLALDLDVDVSLDYPGGVSPAGKTQNQERAVPSVLTRDEILSLGVIPSGARPRSVWLGVGLAPAWNPRATEVWHHPVHGLVVKAPPRSMTVSLWPGWVKGYAIAVDLTEEKAIRLVA
jgi:hypothetical protein